MRLESVIHQEISDDGTGLIRNCHSFSNVRRLLSVIHSAVSGEVVSLDTEKTFNGSKSHDCLGF